VNCFHCNGTVPVPSPSTVEFDGQAQECCSQHCADTAQGIIDRGLGEFYRHRVTETIATAESSDSDLNWESFERPAVMREFVNKEPNGKLRAELIVQGVHCGACTWLIERALSGQAGIDSIQVNPVTTRGTLIWDPKQIRLSDVLRSIAALGYTPAPFTEQATEEIGTQEYRASVRRLLVAGLGMMQVMSYAVGLYAGALDTNDPAIGEFLRLISLLVATPVVIYAGAPFFRNAWNNIKARSPGMDVPVALAIGAAYSVSVWNTLIGNGEVYFDSATMFVFFLSATRFLEMSGRHKAISLTGAMARHLPKTAVRIVDGRSEIVGVMELEAGDRVLVQPGQALPADGFLDDDSAKIDEALLTGESEPVSKRRDQSLLAGSINVSSAIHIRVDKVGAETVLAGIGRMVTEAREHKPKLVQLADKVGGWFVAAMLVIAGMTATAWYLIDPSRVFEITLAVLVVTCPCALALATPAAFSVALSSLARTGLLLRRPGALQTLCEVNEVVFDKTGTLTSGQFDIRKTHSFGKIDSAEALHIAAGLEHFSEHPLARAFPFVEDTADFSDVTSTASEGLEGNYKGNTFRIGKPEFVAQLSNSDAKSFAAPTDASRAVYLGNAEGLVTRFDIAEHIREEAPAAVKALHQRKLHLTVASGDHMTPVSQLAKQLGIDAWYPSLKADEKLKLVRRLQRAGNTVAVVGDGVNDSPVLAGADVSVAMGGGTSLAQHSADCVLMGNSLHTLTEGFRIADKTMMVVKQNLIWAACYNLTAVPLAAFGLLDPWMAALGMSLSSLLVTMNALRIGRSSPVPTAPTISSQKPDGDDSDKEDVSSCCKPKCCDSKAEAAS